MADTGVVDLDAHFVGLGRRHLDVLDGEGFAGAPRDGGLHHGQPGWWCDLAISCEAYFTGDGLEMIC